MCTPKMYYILLSYNTHKPLVGQIIHIINFIIIITIIYLFFIFS